MDKSVFSIRLKELIGKSKYPSNLKRLAEEMSGLKEGVSFNQPTLSAWTKSDSAPCPTVEKLMVLADYFDVSIDWLVGHKNKSSYKPGLYDFCKYISDIFENFSDIRFCTITKEEQTFDMYIDEYHANVEYQQRAKDTTYNAIYFSNWSPPANLRALEEYSQTGNYNYFNSRVNRFLEKYISILNMKAKGHLDSEQFDILLNSYLDALKPKQLHASIKTEGANEDLPFPS